MSQRAHASARGRGMAGEEVLGKAYDALEGIPSETRRARARRAWAEFFGEPQPEVRPER